MPDVNEIGPAVVVSAVIAVAVFILLCGATYFRSRLPDAPVTPSQFTRTASRAGIIIFMVFVSLLVAERYRLYGVAQMWVGGAGALFGFVAEAIWRWYDRYATSSGGRGQR